MKSNEYYYCLTHKTSILPEDKAEHDFPDCNFIVEEFKDKGKSKKIRLHWAAATVAKKHGMQIYTAPKKDKVEIPNTIPEDAILIDTDSRGKDLNG